MRDRTTKDEEWETLRRKKGKEKEVEDPSTTIFLANLPDEVSDKEIWLEIRRCGYLSDVYFPKKRDLKGKRFAFARFKKIRDISKLVQALNNVWFGDKRVKANVSKFQREEDKGEGGNKKYYEGGRNKDRRDMVIVEDHTTEDTAEWCKRTLRMEAKLVKILCRAKEIISNLFFRHDGN
ncbi:polyadenylate-binding protein, cytoplasmic and nuclear-like [Helianthus annuus]|uniref:polyadenylate-binding protein, cytoplasmic and nuclear-like n=1 Tax=Helianthus annuus TaxID=4232 RepID=UPI000B8F64A9|nr:polyadenylate-binding protein, cytoplasmic and nuclear-like [Helianthus annuus]